MTNFTESGITPVQFVFDRELIEKLDGSGLAGLFFAGIELCQQCACRESRQGTDLRAEVLIYLRDL